MVTINIIDTEKRISVGLMHFRRFADKYNSQDFGCLPR